MYVGKEWEVEKETCYQTIKQGRNKTVELFKSEEFIFLRRKKK